MQRYEEVSRVLSRVLVLNLVVALAKIALGLVSGAVSVLSDGFHSLTDGASNLVAMIGVRVARQPPDEDHPYGHRKFETLASVGILIFLVLVLVQVASAAAARLRSVEAPRVDAVAFWVMGSTFAINLAVVLYERRAGRRLSSEILLADAHHTTSDLATSLTVIAALVGVRFGYSWLDPAAALVVAGFIAYACWEIFRDTSRILGDRTGRARLPSDPHPRFGGPRLPRPARLDGRPHAAARGPPRVSRGEGSADGALSRDKGCGDPPRTTAWGMKT